MRGTGREIRETNIKKKPRIQRSLRICAAPGKKSEKLYHPEGQPPRGTGLGGVSEVGRVMRLKLVLEKARFVKEMIIVSKDVIIGENTGRPTAEHPPDGRMKGKTFLASRIR
jgi:hypothetical protein